MSTIKASFSGQDHFTNIERFIPDINNFIEDCKKENEFYEFRYFTLHNIKIFMKNSKLDKRENLRLQNIIENLIEKRMNG